jgi:beta-lactamase superfamily II metal-dependent hydrolase
MARGSSMKCHILDVGQASSVVLDFQNGSYGIVDCGGATGEHSAPVVDFLKTARDNDPQMRIAFLMISHLDLDHINALSVLKSDDDLVNRIERIYCNDLGYRRTLTAARIAIKPGSGVASNTRNRAALRSLSILANLGNLVRSGSKDRTNFHFEYVAPEASRPDNYPVELTIPCERPDIRFQLWCPTQALKDEGLPRVDMQDRDLLRALFGVRNVENWNAASVVLTVDVNGTRFLLAGDSTARTWQEVFKHSKDHWEGADVVVAWHHGGRLGTRDGQDFDKLVWERVLIRKRKIVGISCGSSNTYGHPHPDTIRNITQCGGNIYCTEKSRRNTPSGRARGQIDSIAMQLHGVAKKVWYQIPDEKCCGDITVEVRPDNELVVTCSSGECSTRVYGNNCCVRTSPQQSLLSLA